MRHPRSVLAPCILVCFLSLFFLVVSHTLPALAAKEAGHVVSLTPGAFVERGGKSLPLELKSAVETGDTITTNATGRVRIIFSDNSSMSLGSSTRLTLRDYTPDGNKPVFGAHLGGGLARAITGKIVEQNPAGFVLTTPEATIGIRGTIITVRSGNGVTTAFVENTLRKVFVNNVDVPGGHMLTVPGDSQRPEPIRPEDRRKLGEDLAFNGGMGVVAAAPEPGQQQSEESTTRLVSDASLPSLGSSLSDIPLATQNAGDTLLSGTGGGAMGVISGTLGTTAFDLGGSFSFNIDVQTGAISNATMGASDTGGTYFSLSGGTGSLSGGTLSVTSFSGTYFDGILLQTLISTGSSNMGGAGAYSVVGDPVSGWYMLYDSADSFVDSDSLTGSRTQ